MQKIKTFIKSKKKLSLIIIIIILAIGAYLIFKKNNNSEQVLTIKTGDFVDQVSISGKVVSKESAELGFKNSGRIENVYFSKDQLASNKVISAGTEIVKIDATDAEKNVHDALTNLENAKLSLQKLELQNSNENMNANLQKAYDDGFIEVSNTFLDLQPKIEGLQNLLAEDNVSDNVVRNSGSTAQNYRNDATKLYYQAKDAFEKSRIDFRALDRNSLKADIEKIINETYDTTKIFMDAIKSAKNLVDYLVEDTGRAADYTSSQSTLYGYANTINMHLTNLLSIKTSIKDNKDVFSSTDLDVQSLTLSIKQKENALQDARNNLADYYITAPFDGIITRIDAKVGEIAPLNTPLVTMMSVGTFQIESYVPEVNIASIKVGNEATITLDAYGDSTTFQAKVISIDPAETIRDGVSTYKTRLQFIDKDDRIKSGMTANVLITIFSKPNTIVVPGGVVFEKNGLKFVEVKVNNKIEDREVTIGSVSSLGQLEIISGLSPGDKVILNPQIK